MEKTGFCEVGCGSGVVCGGVFGLFLANLPLNMLVPI